MKNEVFLEICEVTLLKYCKQNVRGRHNINILGVLFCLERTKFKIGA
jgi:hypothetical protein